MLETVFCISLTLQNPVVTIGTCRFKVKKSYVLHTRCLCVCRDLRI